MYALIAVVLLMSGEPIYLNTTYWDTKTKCEDVKNAAEDYLITNPNIQDYRFKCLKVPESVEYEV